MNGEFLDSLPLIGRFLSSWELFQNSYLSGWAIAALLSLIGVAVVARDQIFIGAALSQSSTLGIAIGKGISDLAAGGALAWFGTDAALSLMAVVFSVAAAMVTARGGGRRESQEAVTGWVFLLAASLSILVVAHSPHGLEDVHRLLSSSIIGNTVHDVWTFAILGGATALAIAFLHRRILLLVLDPAMAAAAGMRTAVWGMAINAWLGLAVGLSIRASGMLYTFGCLVLPALVAKSLCREVRTMFLAAPAVAVGTSLVGFVLAYDLDYPPAQMAIALLCIALVLAWTFRALRARWKAD